MSISAQSLWFAAAALCVGATLPAHADLEIAKRPTKNLSCAGGSCVATAPHAVINAADLRHLLAAQPVVSLDAGPAKNIVVEAALTWTSGNALSLTATGALSVNQPITVSSKAVVTITSASMVFAPKASLTFWDVTSSLTINGQSYHLERDLPTMVKDFANTFNHGYFALANDYDATPDGTYMDSPISYLWDAFEGLGHTISNLTMKEAGPVNALGLFAISVGKISNISLVHTGIATGYEYTGLLVGWNVGTIVNAAVEGTIQGSGNLVGGLVGNNDYNSSIVNSRANVRMVGTALAAGGLVGLNGAAIDSSFSEGSMRDAGYASAAGGLVGEQWGQGPGHTAIITNSYSTVNLTADFAGGHYGGLIGYASDSAVIQNSYAAGKIRHKSGALRGGIIGDDVPQTSFRSTYWDLDDGVSNPAHGAANVPNVAGITGLTDAQLKSGLPAGFDPKVWAQSPSINDGYPYLRSNPPQ